MRREGEPPEEPTPGPGGEPAPADRASPEAEAAERARRARIAKVVVGLILLVILIVFVSTNLSSTRVHFVFFSANAPLIWVMLGCAILGGIVGFLVGKPGKQIGRRRDERRH